MSRFHVIGATGFVGRALFEAAKFVAQTQGTSSTGADGYSRLALDKPSAFDLGAFRSGDVIFFTAAVSAPDLCAEQPDRVRRINVEGTSEIIELALARGAKVIFFSSDAVYGEQRLPFDEAAAPKPAGDYAAMKRAVELRFADQPGFKSVRLSYVFAAQDKFTQYLLGCLSKAETAKVFHPFFRSVIHRNDVVDGAIGLARLWDQVPDRIINFGGPEVISRIEFTKVVSAATGGHLSFSVVEPPDDFFNNRPRYVSMRSPHLATLLGHAPATLAEAAHFELRDYHASGLQQ